MPISGFRFWLVIVAEPLVGVSAIAFWLGAYVFVFGALLVALACRLRGVIEIGGEPHGKPAA
jgi:uncharacterized membrane protein HdeD (DUF308 family)